VVDVERRDGLTGARAARGRARRRSDIAALGAIERLEPLGKIGTRAAPVIDGKTSAGRAGQQEDQQQLAA